MNSADFLTALGHCEAARECFDSARPLTLARAPGRLDVMGGIADYSGSLVLEMPLREATWAAAQPRTDGAIHILVLDARGRALVRRARFDATAFTTGPAARTFTAGDWFAQTPGGWVGYVAGTLTVLVEEYGLDASGGLSLCVASQVPEGLGVSSSAAVEVASMLAASAALGLRLKAPQLALACQRVENSVVGAPCGVMDQMTSACGEAGALLALLCQPATLQGTVPLPEGLAAWGIDSGIRHAVSGTDYTSVRIGAFMGHRILTDLRGLSATAGERAGLVQIDDPEWGGYLANLTPSVYLQRYREHLPEALTGAEFLQRYRGTTDPVTRVQPEVRYAVRRAAEHAVFEHHRVQLFRQLLLQGADETARVLLGELMYQSHASYSACGLGSLGTDRIVELVRSKGLTTGLFGAKISGGGSGGTVVVLGRVDAEPEIHDVAARYAQVSGHHPHVFAGSSPGASSFGTPQATFRAHAWQLETT